MRDERDEVLGQGLLRAATRAVNLCFAGVMATSSVVVQSWPLFGVSVGGYATLVAWDLTRIGFWKRVLDELRTRPPSLPGPEAFTDNGARHFLHRLHQARSELRRVSDGGDRPLPVRLRGQVEALPELEKRALILIGRLEEVSRYLADKNLQGLRAEVERLRRSSENTSDLRLRIEYKKAHFALHEELLALEQIVASRDLVTAKLETLAGTLEMFPCEVVRLRVLEADVRDHADDWSFDPRVALADSETLNGLLADSSSVLEEVPRGARG